MDANEIREIRIIRENPRFRRYPEYKDSGVEWIGEIPRHWKIERIKYIATFVSEKFIPETDAIKISPENVESKTGKVLDFYSSYDSIGVKFQVGDVLFNKIRVYLNKVVFAEYSGYSLGEMIVIRPSLQDIGKYLFYLMLSSRFIEYCNSISKGAKMPRTDVYDILNAQIPITSYQEQAQIVNFLDRKTGQIGELIRIKERRIELLQSHRTALINQAVTKGLDPNVEMKPSGVEWIGEIPAHWEVIPIKHTLQIAKDSIRTGPFGSSLKSHEFQDKGIRVYNQQSVYNEDFSKSDIFISEEKFNELRSFIVQPKDVLITSRGTIGKMTIVPKNGEIGVLHPCLIRLRLNENKLIPKYLWWYVNHSSFFIESVKIASNSTTIDVIYSETLSSVKIPIPAVKEQLAILEFLNVKIPIIDTTISNERKKIELLKEYRQSLISEAVTGKIDVRNEV